MAEGDSTAVPSQDESEAEFFESHLFDLFVAFCLAMQNLNEAQTERNHILSQRLNNAIVKFVAESHLDEQLKIELRTRAFGDATELTKPKDIADHDDDSNQSSVDEVGYSEGDQVQKRPMAEAEDEHDLTHKQDEGTGEQESSPETPLKPPEREQQSSPETSRRPPEQQKYPTPELPTDPPCIDLSRSVNSQFAAKLKSCSGDHSLLTTAAVGEPVLFVEECDPYSSYANARIRAGAGLISLEELEQVGKQFGCFMRDTVAVATIAREVAAGGVKKDFACTNFCLSVSSALNELEGDGDNNSADNTSPLAAAAIKATERRYGKKQWVNVAKLGGARKAAFATIGYSMVGARLYGNVTFAMVYAICGDVRRPDAAAMAELGREICNESIHPYTMAMCHQLVLVPALANKATFVRGLKAVSFVSCIMGSKHLNDAYRDSEIEPWVEGETGNVLLFDPFFSATDNNGEPTDTAQSRKLKCSRMMASSAVAPYAADALTMWNLSKESVPDVIFAINTMSSTKFKGNAFNFLLDITLHTGEYSDDDMAKVSKIVKSLLNTTKTKRKQWRETPVFRDITSDLKEESLDLYADASTYLEYINMQSDLDVSDDEKDTN